MHEEAYLLCEVDPERSAWYCMSREITSSRTHSPSSSKNLSILTAGEHFHGYYSLCQEHFKATLRKCIEFHCCLTVVWECCGVSMRLSCARVNHRIDNISVLLHLDEQTWARCWTVWVVEPVVLCLCRFYYGKNWFPVPSKSKTLSLTLDLGQLPIIYIYISIYL